MVVNYSLTCGLFRSPPPTVIDLACYRFASITMHSLVDSGKVDALS